MGIQLRSNKNFEFVISTALKRIVNENGGFPNVHSKSGQEVITSDGIKEPTEKGGDTEMKNYVEFKTDKPTFVCHIEYILAPEVQPKSVDIICWEKAAKIYVEKDSAAITPLALDRILWIYFRVERVTTINNEDVNAYYNRDIAITVSLDSKKLGQSAKSENVKVFYGRRYESSKLFPSLWENPDDITLEKVKTTNSKHVLSANLEAAELSNKLRTVIKELTEEYHRGDWKPMMTGQKHPPWKTHKAESNTNGKTISHTKEDPKSEISFVITGESILSGLKIFENYVKYKSEELPFLYSAVQVENVLDPQLAKRYNPLSITLKHLNFMPVSILQKQNIQKVRFLLAVCESYETQSNDMEVSENMKLNYTRTILTDQISTPELIEYIQTKGLTVTLLGVMEEGGNVMKKVKPKMYKDQRINCKSGLPGISPKNRSIDKTDTVILGIAKIDISSLLIEPHQLSVKYNFTCGEFDHQKLQKTKFCSTVNPTEVNNTNHNLKRDSLCHELISSSAVLTVSVRLCFPVWKHFEIIRPFVQSRNRIFIMTSDINTAVDILERIQAQNGILAPTDHSKSATQIDRPSSNYDKEVTRSCSEFNMLSLTGFLVDCVDYYLIYVESPNFGLVHDIWSAVSFIHPSEGHILYDSSLLFNQISYGDLIRYGGFYIISLREAPAVVLSNKNTYRKGNIPSPAYKALIQLYHLSRCSSMTKAVQHNLFPDYQSLLSLDLEFGVPHMFIQFPP